MVDYGRCPRCDSVMLPVLDRSPCGHLDEPVLESLDQPGVVYSWTISHLVTDGDPILLAMADFLDGRIRITAPVLGAGLVEIGDAVEALPGAATPLALRAVGVA